MRVAEILAAIILFTGVTAAAGQSLPEGYRYMGPDRADSTCIGDISTPECVADTYRACFVRSDPSLCAKVGLDGIAFSFKNTEFFVLYRIVDVVPITEDRITPALAGESWFRPGNVEVRVKSYGCEPGSPCPDPKLGSPKKTTLFLTPVADGWRLVGWADFEGPVVCENESPGSNPYHRDCGLFVHNDELPWIFEYD